MKTFTLNEREAAIAAGALHQRIWDWLRPDDRYESDASDESDIIACEELLIRLNLNSARGLSKELAEKADGWEWPAGAGLEDVPPAELYAARTAQLEGQPWRGRTGDEKIRADQRGEVMGAVPNKIERLKAIALVRTMESDNALLPETVIITVQNDPNTHFKPHIGESWRAQVNQFRNPEHLAEALAEPDPDLIEAVRTARRDAPDERVIVLWHSPGRTLAWAVRAG